VSLSDDLKSQVVKIFKEGWAERDGTVVPTSDDVKLGNDAVKLQATVLYADLDASTSLVDKYKPYFASEVYKTFLYCAAKIIRAEGGEITAYDGDRVMAVFLGNAKNTSAARAALKLNYARLKIIQPSLDARYPGSNYTLRHVVGIDTSSLYVVRTGIRGANDLVWVGRAANYAAKLSALTSEFSTQITKDVYDMLHATLKQMNGKNMWSEAIWNTMGGMKIYRSTSDLPV
jgi:class 3 adenylate cyclase